MDIIVFSNTELPLVLSALRTVAAQPQALSQAETEFLQELARLHGIALDLNQLPDTALPQVESAIASPHQRKRLVQLAISFAMLSCPITPQQEIRLNTLAQALAVREPALTALHHILNGRTPFARLLIMRRIMGRFFKAAWQEDGLQGIRLILEPLLCKRGGQNPALAQRFEQLQHLPTHTLGYAFWQHCTSRQFLFPGQAGAIPERLVFHDFGHLLSGYDTDPMGEIQQGAFQAGFVRDDGFVFLLFAILQFHWGIQITPVAEADRGRFEPQRVLQALYRGSLCQVDLSRNWDFWAVMNQPLEQVRDRTGVPDQEFNPNLAVSSAKPPI